MSSDSYHFDFEPNYFVLPKIANLELTDIIYENLTQINNVEAILGLTIIRYDGRQPLVFSADETNFEYLKTLGEIFSSMEPVSYFKDLTRNFEFKGIGHLNFDDFDLYMVKIAPNLLFTVMVIESTNQVFKTCQDFVDQLFQVFNHQKSSEKGSSPTASQSSVSVKIDEEIGTFAKFNQNDDNKKPKKAKTPSKSDLKKLLKEKLEDMGTK